MDRKVLRPAGVGVRMSSETVVRMKRGFSIAELVIVAAIIGILAALVIPYFQSEAMEAKQAAAKDNLRSLRGAVELYAARHSGVAPGYVGGTSDGDLDPTCFSEQAIEDGCLRQMPVNPFNNLSTILMIADDGVFPTKATGRYGWIYMPATRTFRLDWPGLDRQGTRYFDY